MNTPPWLAAVALIIGIASCSAQEPAPAASSSTKQQAEPAPPPKAASDVAGTFASGAPVQLPVEVSSSTGPVPRSRAAGPVPADVARAIQEKMGSRASDINVTVEDGIVYLSGQVAREADLQHAHYLASAVPGVVEVDHSTLRIE